MPALSRADAYDPQIAIPWASSYINALNAQYGGIGPAIQHIPAAAIRSRT